MNKKYLILVFFTFALLGCKKDKLEGDKAILIGKWKWDHTYHMWCDNFNNQGYSPYTPANTNTTYTIEFLEEGKILFYKNDTLKKEKRIVFNYFKLSVSGNYEISMYLDNNVDDEFFIELNDTSNYFFNSEYPYLDNPAKCDINNNYFIKE